MKQSRFHSTLKSNEGIAKRRASKDEVLPDELKKTGLPKFGNGLEVLITEYEPTIQIVEDLIVEGLTFFAGVAKLGKTTLLLQMLQIVCDPKGGELFGRKVHPGKVLFISLEEDRDSIHEKMIAQGWTKEEASNFTIMDFNEFCENIGFLHTQGAVVKLLEYILEGEFLVVAVDNFKKAFLGMRRQDDSDIVTQALTPIHEIVKAKHISFIFIDHHGHARGLLGIRNTDPCDSIMNSSSKGQVADTALGFYEDGVNKRLVRAVGRHVSVQGLKLVYDEITMKSSRVEGDEEMDLTGRQARILRWVRSNHPVKLIQIEKGTGIASSNIQPIVKAMVRAGLLSFDEVAKTYEPIR